MKKKPALSGKENIEKMQSVKKQAAHKLLESLAKSHPVESKNDKEMIREHVKRKFN